MPASLPLFSTALKAKPGGRARKNGRHPPVRRGRNKMFYLWTTRPVNRQKTPENTPTPSRPVDNISRAEGYKLDKPQHVSRHSQ